MQKFDIEQLLLVIIRNCKGLTRESWLCVLFSTHFHDIFIEKVIGIGLSVYKGTTTEQTTSDTFKTENVGHNNNNNNNKNTPEIINWMTGIVAYY